MWHLIDEAITQATGSCFQTVNKQAQSGGCINHCYRLQGKDRDYFVKLNQASRVDMFSVEALGLKEMAATETVVVPKPVCHGVAEDKAYLVLEYLSLRSKNQNADRDLGFQLAQMHQIKQAYFGWSHENTIGSTPQKNEAVNDWVDFFQHQRLEFQLQLAAQHGYTGRLQRLGEQLILKLNDFFPEQLQPALLHGDLWGGNYAMSATGKAVIFDPACYYGDREADIAMTELFGGFGADFYAVYSENYPLAVEYQQRKQLYNLYHLLNHLNLFGGSYLSQSETTMQQLLTQV